MTSGTLTTFFTYARGTKIQQQAQKATFKSVLVPNLTKMPGFSFFFLRTHTEYTIFTPNLLNL